MWAIRIQVRESSIQREELSGFVYQPKNATLISPTKQAYKFVCRYDEIHAIFTTELGLMYPDTSKMIFGFHIDTYSFPILDDAILVGYDGKAFSGVRTMVMQAYDRISFFNDSDRSTWASGGYIKQW